jgi:transcriptional regulator GlxA family with amidase domain
MKAGFIVYSDMTEIEFVCVHECLSKVFQLDFPDPPECHVIGLTPEIVGWNGILIRPHHLYKDVAADDFDLMVVSGGLTSRTVRYDRNFMAWLGRRDRAKPIASICSGALILAEGGFLDGKRATTHTLAKPQLAAYPKVTIVHERVVDEGTAITSGGLMAGFDLGLHLVERFWGAEARRIIAQQDEYRDVEKHPEAAKLVRELDVWHKGGHRRANLRPAHWVAPPPDDGIERNTVDYAQRRPAGAAS